MTLLFFTKHTVKKIDPSTNRIGGVMVSVLASRAIDRGFVLRSGQIKDYKLVLVASPINTQHYAEKAKTGWLETFWSSTKARPHHHFIEN